MEAISGIRGSSIEGNAISLLVQVAETMAFRPCDTIARGAVEMPRKR
jgi:hypothetical protein